MVRIVRRGMAGPPAVVVGVDNIIAVFTEAVGTSLRSVDLNEAWGSIRDL